MQDLPHRNLLTPYGYARVDARRRTKSRSGCGEPSLTWCSTSIDHETIPMKEKCRRWQVDETVFSPQTFPFFHWQARRWRWRRFVWTPTRKACHPRPFGKSRCSKNSIIRPSWNLWTSFTAIRGSISSSNIWVWKWEDDRVVYFDLERECMLVFM